MAVSLGFGILFATLVTLVLIPVNYMILEDLKALFKRRQSYTANPGATVNGAIRQRSL